MSIAACVYLYVDQATTAARWQEKAKAEYGEALDKGESVQMKSWWTENPIWLGLKCWAQDTYSWILGLIFAIAKFGVKIVGKDYFKRRNEMWKRIVAWFKGSVVVKEAVDEAIPYVEQVGATLVSNIKSQVVNFMPTLIAAVKAAALNPNLSGAQKLAAVMYTVEQAIPNVESNLLKTAAESVYYTLMKDPSVPEVPDKTVPPAPPVPVAPPTPPALIIPPGLVADTSTTTPPVVTSTTSTSAGATTPA